MQRTHSEQAATQRGVILLVVVALLTLFALVGLSFVLYAEAQGRAAQLERETGGPRRADLEPELLLNHFLGQLLYDVRDDETGVWSALRGHSLARSMYGWNSDDPGGNRLPFNGTGRLREPSPFRGADGYELVNYTYFPADGFLRDPERLGWRAALTDRPGLYTGGFNAPYTYPDLNNMFLAAITADGTVLLPSFHRPWLFGSFTDPNNDNWSNREGKYRTLRLREIDQRLDPAVPSAFPHPEDAGGDVKNLVGGPGGNDSVWIDLGFPVQTAPDGRRYKPLFAALIQDLDNRINLNLHGNARGQDGGHVSNQGWGPWEVNPRWLSRPAANPEWTNLFTGHRTLRLDGRYGPDQQPGTAGAQVSFLPRPHGYAQVDYDSRREPDGRPTARILLPGEGGPPLRAFPFYPALPGERSGYDNAAVEELRNHPSVANHFRPTGDDRVFTLSNMEALLRHGDTGSPALTSELFRLCPTLFEDAWLRRLVTTYSFDVDRPGLAPWLYDRRVSGYEVSPNNPKAAPQGPAQPFPRLTQRAEPNPPVSDFRADWRARLPARERLAVHRRLVPFPHQGSELGPPLVRPHDRFDGGNEAVLRQHEAALRDRQVFARQLYELLLAVAGVNVPSQPNDRELMPMRWLAQLAVNMVDFLDEDDICTPFNFHIPADGQIGAFTGLNREILRYWVFGTELPRVVLNEVLAEHGPAPGGVGTAVNVWVELFNPLTDDPPANNTQPHHRLPVPLWMPAVSMEQPEYSTYQVVLAGTQRPPFGPLLGRRDASDNVLGTPLLTWNAPTTFPEKVNTATDSILLQVPSTIAPQQFFLVGPKWPDAHQALRAQAQQGTIPNNTPWLRADTMQCRPARKFGPTVLLRRLANPHLPPNPKVVIDNRPNPLFNPYVTVDYLEAVPQHHVNSSGYASHGKRHPYAAHTGLMRPQQEEQPRIVHHTFGRRNQPLPPDNRYDWLVHLDRVPTSPLELLHVAGCPPHELTHRFLQLDENGQPQLAAHHAPWFDPTARIHRVLEFLTVRDRPRDDANRVAGKVNINTIWDRDTLLALCDPQPANEFTVEDVLQIFDLLQPMRDGRPDGGPTRASRPFLPLSTGYSLQGDAQHPMRGRGINDTLLRSVFSQADEMPGAGHDTPRLFEVPGTEHPWRRFELLAKIGNHLTTRSNVFAVWLTVGFFEVTDATARPVKLGAEIGRAENRHVRHRMFAIVDRSVLRSNPGPQTQFRLRDSVDLVPYFSIID